MIKLIATIWSRCFNKTTFHSLNNPDQQLPLDGTVVERNYDHPYLFLDFCVSFLHKRSCTHLEAYFSFAAHDWLELFLFLLSRGQHYIKIDCLAHLSANFLSKPTQLYLNVYFSKWVGPFGILFPVVTGPGSSAKVHSGACGSDRSKAAACSARARSFLLAKAYRCAVVWCVLLWFVLLRRLW